MSIYQTTDVQTPWKDGLKCLHKAVSWKSSVLITITKNCYHRCAKQQQKIFKKKLREKNLFWNNKSEII